MALVTNLEADDHEFRSLHPTQVTCRYIVREVDGKKILQLNTYGSENREIPKKLSQTLQFDESSAKLLKQLLAKEFPNA